MSETSAQIQTQASVVESDISLDSAGRPIITHGQSQARKQQTKPKPRFAEFACSVGEARLASFHSSVFTTDHRLIGVPLRHPRYKDSYPNGVLGERKEFQGRDAE